MTSPTPEPTVEQAGDALIGAIVPFFDRYTKSEVEQMSRHLGSLIQAFEDAIVRRERERSSALLEAAEQYGRAKAVLADATIEEWQERNYEVMQAHGALVIAALHVYEASLAETPEEAK